MYACIDYICICMCVCVSVCRRYVFAYRRMSQIPLLAGRRKCQHGAARDVVESGLIQGCGSGLVPLRMEVLRFLLLHLLWIAGVNSRVRSVECKVWRFNHPTLGFNRFTITIIQ